jgi:hypothetical protein
MRVPVRCAIAMVALFFATSANAAPTYLTCMMTTSQELVRWDVTLDEAAAKASYSIPSLNVVQTLPAVFTPDKVLFGTMEISRVDLTLKRTVKILDEVRVDTGQCSLAPAPKRQF